MPWIDKKTSEKRPRDYTGYFVAAVLVSLAVLVFGLLLMTHSLNAGDATAYPAKLPRGAIFAPA